MKKSTSVEGKNAMPTKRVLIIDSDVGSRQSLVTSLTQKGFTCTACSNGISAIHELARFHDTETAYSCLIIDIFLPDIDGLKILKAIRASHPDLPFLVTTAFGDDSLKKKVSNDHNTKYLEKPVNVNDLIEHMGNLTLNAASATSELAEKSIQETNVTVREKLASYLAIRIMNPAMSQKLFEQLTSMENISSCEAVRGDIDIMILTQEISQQELDELLMQLKAIPDINVLSVYKIEPPILEQDIYYFLQGYQSAQKNLEQPDHQLAAMSYLLIDIEQKKMQNIFTIISFIDTVTECNLTQNSTKLMVKLCCYDIESEKIIAKLKQIDGILRVREIPIIQM